MERVPGIIIFDVGKTNKKVFIFNEDYRMVHQENVSIPETTDEDGFPSEDITALTKWVIETFERLSNHSAYHIKAVNFSGYGASFVLLDESLRVVAPLYNYLKPYPDELKIRFYKIYGGEEEFARITASPVLGNLNSGMQLHRLKYEKPELFKKIRHALHLPQYLSFILSNSLHSEITSIGCHTNLWDFEKQHYHQWVLEEGIIEKLPAIEHASNVVGKSKSGLINIGAGLHDSSAALLPYLKTFIEPFVLISTGTWSISLNPFNHAPLTNKELNSDCLCYLTADRESVKASRLLIGQEHDSFTTNAAKHFNKPVDYFNQVSFNASFSIKETSSHDLGLFKSYEEAYHCFLYNLIKKQVQRTNLVLNGSDVDNIFVDGGFSHNQVFMKLISSAYPNKKVYAAKMAQASAIGAALVIHEHWNERPIPDKLIELVHITR